MGSFANLDRRRFVALGAITLATAGACFLRLGSRSIWGDEAISISYAARSLHGLVDKVHGDPNMSLYYAALWVWTRIVGDGVVAVRALSILFAASTVPVVYALGSRLFNRTAGLVASLALAMNAFFLVYAQEARGYSLVTLLSALSMWFFLEALERQSRLPLVGYALTSALAFYAHFFAAFVTLVQFVFLVVARRRTALSMRWIATFAAIVALVAPVAYYSLAFSENPISWIGHPGIHALTGAARDIAGNGAAPALTALLVLAVGLPLAATLRSQRPALALTGAWLLTPALISFAVSQEHPIFLPRYLVVSIPALALLLGAAVTAVRPPLLVIALAGALLVAASTSLYRWYHRPPVENWRQASAYMLARTEPGDGVVYQMSWAVPAITYYTQRSRDRVSLQFGATDDTFPPDLRHQVWLVLYQDPGADGARLRTSLRERGLRRVAARDFHGDLRLELFAR